MRLPTLPLVLRKLFRRRIVLAARHYLMRLAAPPPCRFDVVAIDGERIDWLRGAFDAS